MSDIEEVLAHYGCDEPNHNGKLCCPLPGHDEDTPSFTVYEDSWWCYGCSESKYGNDAVGLVRTLNPDMSFKEAVEALEGILGEKVALPTGEEKKRSKPRKEAPALPIAVLKDLAAKTTYQDVMYRGIRKETDEFYKIRSEVVDGEVVRRYYPETNENGAVARMKCRNIPKDFGYGHVGVSGDNLQLGGQFKYKGNGRRLLIVAGEDDRAAAYQMLSDYKRFKKLDYFPAAVVSPRNGEGNAHNECARQYDFIDSFDIVILGMDNDKAGEEATRKLIEVLPKEKLHIAKWSKKDPHEMLESGLQREFIQDFYNAKEVIASNIKSSKTADKELDEEVLREKIPLPPFMRKLQHIMAGGIPLGYIVNLGASTGAGKTTIANEMIYYWIFNSPYKIGILSLELNAGQYQEAMLSRHIGHKIGLIESPKDKHAFINQPWVLDKRRELREDEYGQERYSLLDERDGDLAKIKEQINRLVHMYGCKFIVIDPINDLFEGCSLEEQTLFCKYLKTLVKDGVAVVNLCHITKGTTDVDKKTGKRRLRLLTEDDFAGVSNIVKSGGCNILATRDKLADEEEERNSTIIEVPKCRWTGRSGMAGVWYYDNDTHTLYEKEDYFNNKTTESSEEPLPTYDEEDNIF